MKNYYPLLLTSLIAFFIVGCGGNAAPDTGANSPESSELRKPSTQAAAPSQLAYDSHYEEKHQECLPLLAEHAPNMLRLSEAAPSFRFGVQQSGRVEAEDFVVLDESIGAKFDQVVKLLGNIRQTAPSSPVIIQTGHTNGFYLSQSGLVVITLGRKIVPAVRPKPYSVALGDAIIRNLTLVDKALNMGLPDDLKCDDVADHISEASYDELMSSGFGKAKAAMEKKFHGRRVKVQISPVKGKGPSLGGLGPGPNFTWIYVAMDHQGRIDWSTLDEFLE